jgi:leader peptidase (prepilin peptidase)/N-methyltransferase
MLLLFAFIAGTAIGSFLNVCIWRLPRGESIIHPASHCAICNSPIRIGDNIPLLSYAVLRGRCRSCGAHVSLRYPTVELLTGALFVLLVHHCGLTPALVAYALFASALVVIVFIDIDHQIIPDVISLPGIPIGAAASALGATVPVLDSLAGIALGGGLLHLIAWGYYALTGREGMGGGDIKLLAMIGAFIGWRGVLVTLVLGSFSGAIVGMSMILVRGADSKLPIPFGPFLALGALSALFFGEPLIQWYMQLAFAV